MLDRDVEKKNQLDCYLVGVQRSGETVSESVEHLDELERLVETMGLEVKGREMARAEKPHARFLLGSGKVQTIAATAEALEAGLLVVDDDLTPAQQRNWERETKKAVIDRREVILDIFAQRARTREARLQVELAKLEYSLPRLKRAWTHLERQRGGGGFIGGAGEAQIEVDRRLVRTAIARHKRDLEEVRRQRATQRKGRRGRPVPTASLVGYTNSGKSSLLNAFTGAAVLAEDKLFATLDPTVRRINLPNNQPLLLSDTVGFIRKLPHTLVEAFKATLEEAEVADVLLHVIDATHPQAFAQVEATRAVLEELGIEEKPTLYVLNKMDLGPDPSALADLRHQLTPSVEVSAHTGAGLVDLLAWLEAQLFSDLEDMELCLPYDRGDVLGQLHREAEVLESSYEEGGMHVHARVPARFAPRFRNWVINGA